MESCIYHGRVRHRRHAPREHAFTYSMFMLYLDLDELDHVFAGRWLWSTRRAAAARFRREDHFGDSTIPLQQAVRERIEQETGRRPAGPIRLLTHLRYFGHCFNPISLYFVFAPDGQSVETVLAEVTNTPWRERQIYVLSAAPIAPGAPGTFRFAKQMHVSPFMPMDMEYVCRIGFPAEQLTYHMENHRAGARTFDATLNLRREPITTGSLARNLALHPLMTAEVVFAIHWQALRLWLKRVPVFDHPAPLPAAPTTGGINASKR